MRREHGRLAIETKNRSVNVWLFREDADVVRQIPCWKIVGAIDHDVVAGDNLARVLTCELAFMGFDFDVGVRVAQTVARRIQFFATDVLRPMQDLSLEIAKIDIVKIDQTKFADAGSGKIKRGRGTESFRADFRHDHVARITQLLFFTKLSRRDALLVHDVLVHTAHLFYHDSCRGARRGERRYITYLVLTRSQLIPTIRLFSNRFNDFGKIR